MIKEIVALKRQKPAAETLVVPAARSAEFMDAVRTAQAEFSDHTKITCIEKFMELNVRLGGGDRLSVQ